MSNANKTLNKLVLLTVMVFALAFQAKPAIAENDLPLLPDGPQLGFITGFDPLDEMQTIRVAELWRDARNSGVRVARIQVDWGELETAPGVYDTTAFEAALRLFQRQDFRIFVTVSTADSFELTLPADLMNQNGSDFSSGLSFMHPQVLARWESFLQHLAPLLGQHGVFAVSLGNEPDAMMLTRPQMKSDFVNFIAAGRVSMNLLAPDIPTGVTLTGEAPFNDPDFAQAISDNTDVLMYNVYCDPEVSLEGHREGFDFILDAVLLLDPVKSLILQETGCPAGYSNTGSLSGATESSQQDYYQALTEAMKDRPRFRAAFAFQLHDWGPISLSLLVDDFSQSGASQEEIEQFREYWATIGMCSWPDFQCRSAWSTFLQEARSFAGPALLSSVLPQARAVGVGNTASAFAVMINASNENLTNCGLSVPAYLDGKLDFGYHTTTSSNDLVGTPDTPASIPAGGTQHFVFSMVPLAQMQSEIIAPLFSCDGTNPAHSAVGVNRIELSAVTPNGADMLTIVAGPIPGAVTVPPDGFSAFAVAAINLGEPAQIEVSASDANSGLPLQFTICKTDPATAQCEAPPANTHLTAVAAGEIVTYSVFVQSTATTVIDDPALNRAYVRFEQGDRLVGSASLAVRAQ